MPHSCTRVVQGAPPGCNPLDTQTDLSPSQPSPAPSATASQRKTTLSPASCGARPRTWLLWGARARALRAHAPSPLTPRHLHKQGAKHPRAHAPGTRRHRRAASPQRPARARAHAATRGHTRGPLPLQGTLRPPIRTPTEPLAARGRVRPPPLPPRTPGPGAAWPEPPAHSPVQRRFGVGRACSSGGSAKPGPPPGTSPGARPRGKRGGGG